MKKENRKYLKTGELATQAKVLKTTILYYRLEGLLDNVIMGRTEGGMAKFKSEAVELVKKFKALSTQKKTLDDLIK